MFGLGIWEIAVVMLVALLVLGPEKLPGLARKLGTLAREVRNAASEFQSSLQQVDVDDSPADKPKHESLHAAPTDPGTDDVSVRGNGVLNRPRGGSNRTSFRPWAKTTAGLGAPGVGGCR